MTKCNKACTINKRMNVFLKISLEKRNMVEIETPTSWRTFSNLFWRSMKNWGQISFFWMVVSQSIDSSTSCLWMNFNAYDAWSRPLSLNSVTVFIFTETGQGWKKEFKIRIIISVLSTSKKWKSVKVTWDNLMQAWNLKKSENVWSLGFDIEGLKMS